jgi:hypothetical protein
MSNLFFDRPQAQPGDQAGIAPLWTIDLESKEELLTWGRRAYELLTQEAIFRTAIQKELIALYRGRYIKYEPTVGGARIIGSRQGRKNDFPRVVTPHFFSLVEQKVAMQIKYRPETEPYPTSQEFQDKIDAIAAKKFLADIKNKNKADLLYTRFARRSILTGGSFVFPTWDASIGDTKGKATYSHTLEGKDGTKITIQGPERKGELVYRFPKTEDVFFFPATERACVPALMLRSYVNVWDLRARYPEKADEIIPTRDITTYDYNLCEELDLQDHVLVLEFYYRSSHACDAGMYFSMCPTCVLDEVQDNPIPRDGKDALELGNLPCVYLSDIDVDGEIYGSPSALGMVDGQLLYDKLTTNFAMNIAFFCNPKWMFPKNSCDPKSLGNIPGLYVEYTSTPPELAVTPAITQDQFAMRASVLENMEKTFGVYSVSRGAPPPGTRAASQLYYYDEQEAQLNAPFKRKFDAAIEGLDALTLSIIAEKYAGDKQRIVWILGSDNQWISETLDVSALKKPYTIRVKASSNLPDSKFARLNALFELYQMNPNQITWNQLMEMIDFGQQEKLIDYARMAVMTAERENELLQSGKDCPAPAAFEIHLDHWRVHSKLAQTPNFKWQPKEVQRAVEEHIGAHELFMLEIGNRNPIYREALMQIGQFPLYADFPPPNPAAAGAPGVEMPPNPVGRPPTPEAPMPAEALAGEGVAQPQIQQITE